MKVTPNPFVESLGIEFLSINPGNVRVRLKVDRRHLNPWGNLHGGVFATLADTAMGVAARSLGKVAATVNLSLNYVYPVHEGAEVICEGKVIHEGKNIIHTQAVLMVKDKRVAMANGIFYVLNHEGVMEDR
ncbi:MAG: PaaI family thioesterase [Thermanaeromonas sp.]|uniref:PaaI family thioesterase n=1 Tax=Thermanaeromonas sp. TaxID=2003697 RepID=UPI00243BA433|nr:PaaI family thioesterase [Thermanaeromonas sp.]MCG0278529.1 PaaI family thioesterase [Thermanaeromonas sp.]